MHRLSGMDTAFLYLETPTTHMHVQAVMLLDPSTVPGGYSFAKIKPPLAARLPRRPDFRRRRACVPLEWPRPVWFDDAATHAAFDTNHHTVQAPGSRATNSSKCGGTVRKSRA